MNASHGIGYVLSACFIIPHGHTSYIILPAIMRWNELKNFQYWTFVSNILGDIARVVLDNALGQMDAINTGLDMPQILSPVEINPSISSILLNKSYQHCEFSTI